MSLQITGLILHLAVYHYMIYFSSEITAFSGPDLKERAKFSLALTP